MGNRAGARDLEKEKIWRRRIDRWKASNMSQAEFCRKEGLSPNTFASWKTIITRRDAEAVSERGDLRRRMADEVTPGFIRLSLDEIVEDEQESRRMSGCQPSSDRLAAELIDASGGRKLRIFNGADQSIVASVVAAFSATQVG